MAWAESTNRHFEPNTAFKLIYQCTFKCQKIDELHTIYLVIVPNQMGRKYILAE